MKLAGLSPEAHGPLRALRNLREVRRFERSVAQELIQHRHATLVSEGNVDKLRLAGDGDNVRPFRASGRPVQSGASAEAVPIAEILKAKAADCFGLAALEPIARMKANYLSLADNFERMAKDISSRSSDVQPFFPSLSES